MSLESVLPGESGSPQTFRRSLRVANLELFPDEKRLMLSGRNVKLTVREFQILAVLVERAGRVVTRQEIYQLVWKGSLRPQDRSVDVFVRKLRLKLAAAAPEWRYIHTRFGIGYQLDPQNNPPSTVKET